MATVVSIVYGVMTQQDNRIAQFLKYCQHAFGAAGIKVSIPDNTDIRKTYKWRYVKAFLEQMDELGVDDDTIKEIIDEVARYAVKRKAYRMGLSILTSKAAIESCCDAILKRQQQQEHLIERLGREHKLVLSTDLLARKSSNGLPAICRLYMRGDLSTECLALSRRCHKAMMALNKTERALLPTGKALAMARIDMLLDRSFAAKLRAIFGRDWRRI